MLFQDRTEAGRLLADRLRGFAHRTDILVLGLPRGGVPVAYEVARELNLPLDVFIVRKLGAPGHEEYAIGAIASGGVRIVNQRAVQVLRIPPALLDALHEREQQELERRQRLYRGDRAAPEIHGKTVILIDDGVATGSTMRAAAAALRQQGAARIIVAVPVAPEATCDELRPDADEIVCLATPEPFFAVGQWYRDFSQTSDDEVRELLERAERANSRPAA